MAPKMKENQRYSVVSTRLDDETYAWLCKLAKESDTTLSLTVEGMIKAVKGMTYGKV